MLFPIRGSKVCGKLEIQILREKSQSAFESDHKFCLRDKYVSQNRSGCRWSNHTQKGWQFWQGHLWDHVDLTWKPHSRLRYSSISQLDPWIAAAQISITRGCSFASGFFDFRIRDHGIQIYIHDRHIQLCSQNNDKLSWRISLASLSGHRACVLVLQERKFREHPTLWDRYLDEGHHMEDPIL